VISEPNRLVALLPSAENRLTVSQMRLIRRRVAGSLLATAFLSAWREAAAYQEACPPPSAEAGALGVRRRPAKSGLYLASSSVQNARKAERPRT
jgi:hypothetical protein